MQSGALGQGLGANQKGFPEKSGVHGFSERSEFTTSGVLSSPSKTLKPTPDNKHIPPPSAAVDNASQFPVLSEAQYQDAYQQNVMGQEPPRRPDYSATISGQVCPLSTFL